MKNKLLAGILVFGLGLLAPLTASAQTNTLDLVDSYRTDDGRTCIYSNGHRTEVYEKDGAGSCPSKKTFY